MYIPISMSRRLHPKKGTPPYMSGRAESAFWKRIRDLGFRKFPGMGVEGFFSGLTRPRISSPKAMHRKMPAGIPAGIFAV